MGFDNHMINEGSCLLHIRPTDFAGTLTQPWGATPSPVYRPGAPAGVGEDPHVDNSGPVDKSAQRQVSPEDG
jgi:hypothetical protein